MSAGLLERRSANFLLLIEPFFYSNLEILSLWKTLEFVY